MMKFVQVFMLVFFFLLVFSATANIPPGCDDIRVCDSEGCRTYRYDFDGLECVLQDKHDTPSEPIVGQKFLEQSATYNNRYYDRANDVMVECGEGTPDKGIITFDECELSVNTGADIKGSAVLRGDILFNGDINSKPAIINITAENVGDDGIKSFIHVDERGLLFNREFVSTFNDDGSISASFQPFIWEDGIKVRDNARSLKGYYKRRNILDDGEHIISEYNDLNYTWLNANFSLDSKSDGFGKLISIKVDGVVVDYVNVSAPGEWVQKDVFFPISFFGSNMSFGLGTTTDIPGVDGNNSFKDARINSGANADNNYGTITTLQIYGPGATALFGIDLFGMLGAITVDKFVFDVTYNVKIYPSDIALIEYHRVDGQWDEGTQNGVAGNASSNCPYTEAVCPDPDWIYNSYFSAEDVLNNSYQVNAVGRYTYIFDTAVIQKDIDAKQNVSFMANNSIDATGVDQIPSLESGGSEIWQVNLTYTPPTPPAVPSASAYFIKNIGNHTFENNMFTYNFTDFVNQSQDFVNWTAVVNDTSVLTLFIENTTNIANFTMLSEGSVEINVSINNESELVYIDTKFPPTTNWFNVSVMPTFYDNFTGISLNQSLWNQSEEGQSPYLNRFQLDNEMIIIDEANAHPHIAGPKYHFLPNYTYYVEILNVTTSGVCQESAIMLINNSCDVNALNACEYNDNGIRLYGAGETWTACDGTTRYEPYINITFDFIHKLSQNITLYTDGGITEWQGNFTGKEDGSEGIYLTFATEHTSGLRSIYWNFSSITITGIADTTNPLVNLKHTNPSEITTGNIWVENFSIEYEVVEEHWNVSNSTFYIKVNASNDDNWMYINSTGYSGWKSSHIFTDVPFDKFTDSISNVTWTIQEHEIYRATYNVPHEDTDNNAHSVYVLDNKNEIVGCQFFNVSHDYNYSFLEFMVGPRGSASLDLRLYTCNFTWSSGTQINSVPYCASLGAINISEPFSAGHVHTQYSNHSNVTLGINQSSGQLNGVTVTPEGMYFFLRGWSGAEGSNAYYVSNITRTDACVSSGNLGQSTSNLAGTLDMHVHQFSDNDTVEFYDCETDDVGNGNCSTTGSRNINLEHVPPTTPGVFSPNGTFVWGDTVYINYTASIPFDGYTIDHYEINLLNASDLSQLLVISADNGVLLDYTWESKDFSIGEFIVQVYSVDSGGLECLGGGLSENFTVFPINGSINLTLDGLLANRKYEYHTKANVTGISNCFSCNVCLYSSLPGHEGTPFCGIKSVELLYNVTSLEVKNFSDGSDSANLTSGGSKELVLDGNVTISSANFSILKYGAGEVINAVLQVYQLSEDFFFPGYLLVDGVLEQRNFSDDKGSVSLLYQQSGGVTKYVNYSVYDLGLDGNNESFYRNGTFVVTGVLSNPESFDVTDYLYNLTDNITEINPVTGQNYWVYEDASTETSGKWSGSYSLLENNSIQNSKLTTSSSCDNVVESDLQVVSSTGIDVTERGSVIVGYQMIASGCVECDCPPSGVCSARGNARIGVRDVTSSVTYQVLETGYFGGSVYVSGTDYDVKQVSGVWEIKVVGNRIKSYLNGVYQSGKDVVFDSSHQYEIYSATNGISNGEHYSGACGSNPAQADGTVRFQHVNVSGLAGEYNGSLRYDNATFVFGSFYDVQNSNENIKSVIVDWDANVPSGTSLVVEVSADNGINWENVQDELLHIFDNEGQNLSIRFNLSALFTEDTSSGDPANTPVVNKFIVTIAANSSQRFWVDVGGDGGVDGEINETVNETKTYELNFSGMEVRNYIQAYCVGDKICQVPFVFKSNSSGGVKVENISLNTSVGEIRYVASNLTTHLRINSSAVNLSWYGIGSGSRTIDFHNFWFTYPGDWTYNISAKFGDGENSTGDTESVNLTVRHSEFGVEYGPAVGRTVFRFRNWTEENVTPFGQEVNFCDGNRTNLCENESVPVWYLNGSAKIDSMDVVLALNSTLDSCLNVTVNDNITKFGGTVLNTTYQGQNVTQGLGAVGSQGVWAWGDAWDCNRTKVYLPSLYCFYAYCSDCVRTDYWINERVVCLA